METKLARISQLSKENPWETARCGSRYKVNIELNLQWNCSRCKL